MKCAECVVTGSYPRASLCSPCAPASTRARPFSSANRSLDGSRPRNAGTDDPRCSPSAAVKRIRTDEVDRTGNIATVALRHHEENVIRHALADQRVELPREIRPAPFAASCIHVEAEELVPYLFRKVAAREPVDGETVFQRVAPFLAQFFRFDEDSSARNASWLE